MQNQRVIGAVLERLLLDLEARGNILVVDSGSGFIASLVHYASNNKVIALQVNKEADWSKANIGKSYKQLLDQQHIEVLGSDEKERVA